MDNNTVLPRNQYVQKLLEYTGCGMVKVITGVRRCGKSFVMKLYREKLQELYGMDSVVYLDLESPSCRMIKNASDLYSFLEHRIDSGDTPVKYLLLDEVQVVDGWETVVNGYHSTGAVDITVTGSNAHLLSSELGTALTGRYVCMDMYPLSFKEFFEFKGNGDRTQADRLLGEYLTYGSFPAVVMADNEDLKKDMLKALYDSLLFNDVMTRVKNVSPALLRSITQYLFDVIGYPVSVTKLVHSIKSSGIRTSQETVSECIRVMEDAFLFYRVQLYNLKGRERFGINDKYFGIDMGLRSVAVAPGTQSYGSILENIVFLELLRRGWQVTIGRYDTFEVDFVATLGERVEYYQVSQSLLDPATTDREFRSLLSIEDNYPKYVLSLDTLDFSRQGIIHMNLVDWLLA